MSRDAFKVGLGQGNRKKRPRVPARLRHIGRTSDEAQHPCGRLCSECGFLDRPKLTDGYRADANAPSLHDCPNCGATAWLDLGQDDVVQALAEQDATLVDDLAETRPAVALGGAAVGAVGVGLATALAYTFYGADLLEVAAVLGGLALILGVIVGARLVRGVKSAQTRALPKRWHLALPSGDNPAFDRGPAMLDGDPVIAPLSGTPCLAYDVAARLDDDPSAPPASWLLIEQDHAALTCGAQSVPAGAGIVELRSRVRYEVDGETDQARASRFLRERGFESHSVVLYETIALPSASVIAHGDGERIVLELDDRPALPAAD